MSNVSKKIPTSYVFVLGLMLFAMYFGAGNLIFPAIIGQKAGTNVVTSMLGFFLTGVGLPLLSFLTLVHTGKDNIQDLASRVTPWFGVTFAVILYLAIGPFFAIPRAGTVAFEIGIKPFSGALGESSTLFIFSVIFFGIACLMSVFPGKVVDIVGKYLTPLKIGLIAVLIIAAVSAPMGPIQGPSKEFIETPFINGFKEGYLTLDAMASFAFGIIIIDAVRVKGATAKKDIMSASLKAILIAATLLVVMYSALAYMSATSVTKIGMQTNGGEVLAKVSNYYFGTYGNILLGFMISVACMTTCVGLLSSCSSYFNRLYPKISYQKYVILFSVFSLLVSNLGLTGLIKFSEPILNTIYPLAICLVFLLLMDKFFKGHRRVYQMVILFAFVISLFDGLKTANIEVPGISAALENYLPLYTTGLGWVIPAIIGCLVGLVWAKFEPDPVSAKRVSEEHPTTQTN
ncbi:branched-chain amino acid transport system II carrier protein [Vagococcus intermedius]|uniref:Branched-chain amino acid transport system carrier protein n=1 Tax=Vagococcus intermedius TaxID=2991418 RepID=A0AAF0I9T7_9ENTE|nr:branched-chain amino acid transport system II carrier protein [Vagococcus intermedius]WEG73742.1 branched-chain amino acid transport system II carrier protein [Vagococcus intermedius]WEG75827.1 branched-chain amino acid transport system II carrier protein [Vagococcus intermedius]